MNAEIARLDQLVKDGIITSYTIQGRDGRYLTTRRTLTKIGIITITGLAASWSDSDPHAD
jgi:hypothetical protein